MKYMLTALAIGALAACETTPPAPPPVVEMSEDAFTAAMREASNSRNPFQQLARYEQLADQPDLTNDQQARVLYQIGVMNGTTVPNRPEAIRYYEQVIAMLPADHRLVNTAQENIAYARTQLGYINSRIANGTADVDDMLSAGLWDEAIQKIRDGTLNVSGFKAQDLYYAGLFCESAMGRWSIGSENTEHKRVGICDTPRDPINIDPLAFR